MNDAFYTANFLLRSIERNESRETKQLLNEIETKLWKAYIQHLDELLDDV